MSKKTEEEPTPKVVSGAPDGSALSPPYVPWKSFEGFVGVLKGSHPPDTIDGSVMPQSMDGGTQRQIRASLKFLGLTSPDGKVTPQFDELIQAHGTAQWPSVIKENVLPAYDAIVGDLNIERATSAQLDGKFRSKGVASGQMLDKAIRFYLHALKSAEVKYSTLLSLRKDTRASRRQNSTDKNQKKKKERATGEAKADEKGAAPKSEGLIAFPLPFRDKSPGSINVPPDMNDGDMPLFDAAVAMVKAYAASQQGTPKT